MSNVQLPFEIKRYILTYLPKERCMYCYNYMVPINNKFCNSKCQLQYNINFWGDLIYLRNCLFILLIIWSPFAFYEYFDKICISQTIFPWFCPIVSFIMLTFYIEQYFMRKN